MTFHFPDLSPFQGGISLKGAPACALKTTEGTGWASGSWFTAAIGRAHAAGAFPLAYHFLHAGNAAGQAGWCNSHDAGLPLMLDLEPTGSSRPTVADGCAFIDAYRKTGSICNLLYLPHWYWQQLGSPSLAPFAQRGMALWSSAYTTYSDSGPGWAGYGGLSVAVWQHTDKQQFNGQLVDFNACKGPLAQFIQLAAGGRPVPAADPNPLVKMGDTGAGVSKAQTRLNAWGARPALTVDGQFGKATLGATQAFQRSQKLTADGEIGPLTWAHLNANPHPPAPAPSPPHDTAKAGPYHGEWVTAGMSDLADLAKTLGYAPSSVIRMTAKHYGTLGGPFGGYLDGILTGTTPWTAKVPKGIGLWCD